MKLLLADDEQRVVEIISKALEKDKFIVDKAFDGKQAFEKARVKKYDAIILDVMMPEKSGFDVVTSLRALGINTPILMISARSMVEDRVYAINVGADDYLVKNFSLDELIARIKGLIRRSTQKSSNMLYCGNLRLNLSDMSVYKGQKPIYLSKKEMNLLVMLLRNKEKIVSRDDLIEAIWDKTSESIASNTLDVHIRFLREKLGGTGAKSMIRTFRGQGYMIHSLKGE